MKPITGALAFVAATLSACSLSFGTVGTWSNEKAPPTAIQGSNSVVMPNGEIVFFGGFDSGTGWEPNRVLRFDPKATRWSQGAPMPLRQTGYAIAALSNGSVLVAGGGGAGGGNGLLLPATTWLYDPTLNTWSRVGNLHVHRYGATAVLLTDGRVLIAGGSVPLASPIQLPDGSIAGFEFNKSAETFDPQTNSWSPVGSMHVARGSEALVALPHGRVLAAGGCGFADQGLSSVGPLASTEVFDPATGAWTVTSPMPEPLCGASGLLLRDGRALVTGVSASNFQPGSVTNAVLYDEQKHAWTAAGSTVPGASAPILLADGQVFVAAVQAGQIQGQNTALVVGGQVFDPSSGDWRFATSTSVLVSSRLVQGGAPTVVAQPAGTAVIVFGTAAIALSFNPSGTPPPVLILDSSALAVVLAGLAAALCLWLVVLYVRDRLHKGA
jgi:N-acetylneuraminic acid mutarotase